MYIVDGVKNFCHNDMFIVPIVISHYVDDSFVACES